MKKIIALVDGSVYAHSVCDHAAWVAQKTGAEVEFLHVIGRRETGSAKANLSGNITLGARTALLNELSELDAQRAQLSQKIGRAILDDATSHIESKGVEHVTARLRIGDLVETVAEQEAEADLVIVGKRGEAADFAKLHLGSNLERIARSSTKPVFVAARAFRPVQRFMIAYDGGTSAMKAVDHVARSPLFAGLECCLLMVGPDSEENHCLRPTRRGDCKGYRGAGGRSSGDGGLRPFAHPQLHHRLDDQRNDPVLQGTGDPVPLDGPEAAS
jgi:nucleotide-binding universal stress UspA family protein